MAGSLGVGCWILLCVFLLPVASNAVPLDEQIDQQRRELERLQGEIQAKEKKSSQSAVHERSILSSLQEMEDRIRLHEKRLSLLQLNIERKDAQIERLGKDIEVSRRELARKRELMARRLRDLYEEGAGRNLSVLFSAKTEYDFDQRIYYLRWDANKQQEFIRQFKAQLARQERDDREIQEARLAANREKADQVQEVTDLRVEQRKKKVLLASIQNERSTYEKAISELDEASLQLQLLLKDLTEKRSRELSRGGFASEKGRLLWPNRGEVVTLFGRQKHPKFDTYIFRKGIEIRPDSVDSVKAVYDGRVLYADWFKGYGIVIILDHGDNYYSLYAHLGKLLVSAGEHVLKNGIIGTVGETGLVQESRLYFEIRHQGDPMDPLAWLEKRRQQGGKR